MLFKSDILGPVCQVTCSNFRLHQPAVYIQQVLKVKCNVRSMLVRLSVLSHVLIHCILHIAVLCDH